jgi:VIT1/CCC1 family predicted Fe2+/Mn2+ transporter
LAGRQELGPEYDAHFADMLVERLRVEVQREVERQLRASQRRGVNASQRHLTAAQRLGLAIPSLVFLIPLIAIAGGMQGLTGMIIAVAAVVAINIAAGLF